MISVPKQILNDLLKISSVCRTCPRDHPLSLQQCSSAAHASQESVFKLEELVQYDVLSNKETRHTSLNDDNYRQGNKSDKYNNYAIACTLLMKGAIKAVLEGKLYFNSYMCPDLKDRLRLAFPELNESKYWRREATNAKKRRAVYTAKHNAAKKQKTV